MIDGVVACDGPFVSPGRYRKWHPTPGSFRSLTVTDLAYRGVRQSRYHHAPSLALGSEELLWLEAPVGDAVAAIPIPSLLEALAGVPDPRRRRGRRYAAATILTFAVSAMVCGARSLYAIAQWGREHGSAEVRAALGITRASTPSVATLFRLFRDLDPTAFEEALGAWARAHGLPPGEAIALDGKTLRGIHGERLPGVHLVAAYAHRTGAVLAQKGGP